MVAKRAETSLPSDAAAAATAMTVPAAITPVLHRISHRSIEKHGGAGAACAPRVRSMMQYLAG